MGRIIDADEAIKALTGWETEPTDEEIISTIKDVPTVEAVPMTKIDEILDKFSKWMWTESENVRGDQMIDIGYAEGYLRELFDWERKWEEDGE